jgi:hypothetical protein
MTDIIRVGRADGHALVVIVVKMDVDATRVSGENRGLQVAV